MLAVRQSRHSELHVPCMLCQVPVIATLVNTEGQVTYQNQASLKYWGSLLMPQDTAFQGADQKGSSGGK